MSWDWHYVVAAVDVMTGGAVSLSAGLPPGTVAAGAFAAGVAEDAEAAAASRESGGQPGSTGEGVAGAGTQQQKACCPRYQITGELLLETNTGKVWRYDKNKNLLIAVQKKLSSLDYWRTKLQMESVFDGLLKAFDENVLSNLPNTMKEDARTKFNEEYIKVLRDELEKMKP